MILLCFFFSLFHLSFSSLSLSFGIFSVAIFHIKKYEFFKLFILCIHFYFSTSYSRHIKFSKFILILCAIIWRANLTSWITRFWWILTNANDTFYKISLSRVCILSSLERNLIREAQSVFLLNLLNSLLDVPIYWTGSPLHSPQHARILSAHVSTLIILRSFA